VEGLADEAGGALGEVEKRLSEKLQKETEALHGEISLLRTQKASTPQGRKTVSRAPWILDEDNALRN
jgi:hypothetical protein